MKDLEKLVEEYRKAPEIFQAGRYWKAYEDKIIADILSSDINELRSGKCPIFATFGFGETVYYYHAKQRFYRTLYLKLIRKLFVIGKQNMPYGLTLADIREMAYQHCVLQGELAGLTPISEIEVSTFGNPEDLFEIKGKKYTTVFLNYYIRLCYAQKYMQLKGDETIVELGSGSGHQVEVLKKVFPNLTILCFDLPYSIYLGAEYLSKAFSSDVVVKPVDLIGISDLNNIQKGKVYKFGNWQVPLLKDYKFDAFWNAASFGEMEPDIVKNYLSYVLNNCQSIYLLQARNGKESTQSSGVKTPIKFKDYDVMLNGFKLINEADAFNCHSRLSDSGGYFQAVWKK